jgi:excisionase family DNA binding protein
VSRERLPAPVPVTRPSVLVDARLAQETRRLLGTLARDLHALDRPLPDGTWELLRAWNSHTAASADGSGLPDADGQPRLDPSSSPSKPLISTRDAARRANVSDRTIRSWAETAQVAATKVGSSWLIDPDDLARRAARRIA